MASEMVEAGGAVERAHWPEDVRELAFQVWCFVAGRSIKRTAEMLRTEHGHDVPARTLSDWTTRYDWAAEYDRRIASIAPDVRRQILGGILMGALQGVQLVQRALDPDQAGELVALYGKALPGVLNAGLGLVDRAGYSHLGRINPRDIENPEERAMLEQVAGMTPEELRRQDAELAERVRRRRAEQRTKR